MRRIAMCCASFELLLIIELTLNGARFEMKRRDLLSLFASVLAVKGFQVSEVAEPSTHPLGSKKNPYILLTATCRLPAQMDMKEYLSHREKMGNLEGLVVLEEAMVKEGTLLVRKVQHEDAKISWTYLFKDEAAYGVWGRLYTDHFAVDLEYMSNSFKYSWAMEKVTRTDLNRRGLSSLLPS